MSAARAKLIGPTLRPNESILNRSTCWVCQPQIAFLRQTPKRATAENS